MAGKGTSTPKDVDLLPKVGATNGRQGSISQFLRCREPQRMAFVRRTMSGGLGVHPPSHGPVVFLVGGCCRLHGRRSSE